MPLRATVAGMLREIVARLKRGAVPRDATADYPSVGKPAYNRGDGEF